MVGGDVGGFKGERSPRVRACVVCVHAWPRGPHNALDTVQTWGMGAAPSTQSIPSCTHAAVLLLLLLLLLMLLLLLLLAAAAHAAAAT